MSYLYNQIVLFGDSITQFSHNTDNKGWGAALQNLYVRKLDVLNRGFSGYNTENAKKLLLHILPKKNNSIKSPKIYLFTIFFGANDAAISPSNQYVPLVKYKENLRQMIKIIKDSDSPYYSPDTRILLIAPPPLFEKDWEKFQEREGKILPRKLETTAKYAQTCVDLANELNIPVLNAWKLFMDKSTKTLTENNHSLSDFFVDGLHLSNLGNEVSKVFSKSFYVRVSY
ncbi:14445_t:CDS:2 [Funneliformis geosporum]|uniref:18760_t:CDS:1 n=1 Tax=Funneliformis geosporum TaxID=1117311 RepID=A0A9W4SHH9_9GLOM|nr:14445_t:CDS:2 [Funneliformis geosporum]CAI2169649.1 18760_t:CDS:2 [Funneliformis geosporum]